MNPSIPRDLETICLKCLQKRPDQRNASAGALAEDLERYLDGQPIHARPVGQAERLLRWYRRHPVVGSMAAALAVLLIAVPVLLAGLWQQADARANIEAAAHQQEAQAREQESEARRKMEALERERTQQLYQAYVSEAAARRTSPRVGRRFEALARLETARDLAVDLKLPPAEYVRLRSEAISALALTDLRGTATGPGWTFRTGPLPFASAKDLLCQWDKPSGLLLRRLDDNRVVQRIPDITQGTSQYHDFPGISNDNRFVSLVSRSKLTVWRIDGAQPEVVVSHSGVYATAFVPHRPQIILLTQKGELVVQPLDGKGEPKVVRFPEIEREPRQRQHRQDLAAVGGRVAVAGTGKVRLVDLDAGKLVADCEVSSTVQNMAWSPDGTRLAVACDDDNVVLYQPTDKSRRVTKGPLQGAINVAFDPTGRHLLMSSYFSRRGILWDVVNGSAELRFSPEELPMPGPAHAGTASDGWWQPALDTPHQVLSSLLPEGGMELYTNSSAIHPCGRVLAVQTPQGIVLGDVATGQRLGLLPTGPGSTCVFDAAGNLYAYVNGKAHRWPVTRSGHRLQIGKPEPLNLPAIYANFDISADGRVVAQAMDDGSIVLDRRSGKTIRLQPQQDVRLTAVSPDGSLVASFGWNVPGFRLWDATTGKLLHAHDKGTVVWGRFTPDGHYLVTRAGGVRDIELWSLPDCRLVRTLGELADFRISPDSRYLAAAEGVGKVRLQRIDTGEVIARFDAPAEDYLANVNFSPDGRYLFGVNIERTKFHVWDLWKLRRQLQDLKLDWESTPAPEPLIDNKPITVDIATAAPRSSQ